MENKIERLISVCKNISKVIDNITLVLAVCAVACFSGWYFGGKIAEKESTERWIKAVDSTFDYLGYPGELPEMEVEINPFTMKTNIRTDMDEASKNWESYNDDYPYEDSYDANYDDSYYEDSYNYDTDYEDSYNYDTDYYVPEKSYYEDSESLDSDNNGIPDNMVDSNHDGIPDGFSEVRH